MRSRQRIYRGILAAALALLLLIASTPTRYFHTFFAAHEDTGTANRTVSGDQLHLAGFHCQVDNLVVEMPFIPSLPACTVLPSCHSEFVYASPVDGVLHAPFTLRSLRGPPAMA